MNQEAMLSRAIEIAFQAHKNQTDKSGKPYILHCLRVMDKGESIFEKICGVLHDVIEDSDWTFEKLIKEGFSDDVISVLRCVTKIADNENYEAFIERVSQNPTAIRVKMNDLADNLDITRLSRIGSIEGLRLNKYLKAYNFLKSKCFGKKYLGNDYTKIDDRLVVLNSALGVMEWDETGKIWQSGPSLTVIHEDSESISMLELESRFQFAISELKLLEGEYRNKD